jgi:hypothetical protein
VPLDQTPAVRREEFEELTDALLLTIEVLQPHMPSRPDSRPVECSPSCDNEGWRVKRVQDLAWPAQMLIGASTLAAAALIVGLVALVLGAVTQSFFMVDESQSGSDANFGVPIEVDEPEPIISEDG